MKKVKGFSYDVERHGHIINHIDKKPNQSAYLLGLIEKDMANSNAHIESFIKEKIDETIDDLNTKMLERKFEVLFANKLEGMLVTYVEAYIDNKLENYINEQLSNLRLVIK